MTIRTVAAIALAGVLSVGTVAEAQGPRGGGQGRGDGFAGRGVLGGLPLASLDLTQAQRDLIRDIRERHRTALQPVETRLREARASQQKALGAMPVDENAIRTATLAVAEIQAEIAVHQARVRNEIFAALTAEQQEAVRKALAERTQRLEERQSRMRQRRENRQQP